MIPIKKGREPVKLLHYRQQPGASYEEMDKETKEDLLEKLLQEQGHLCAYCMRRIPENRKLPVGVASVTIEHWFPRRPESKEEIGQSLNYKNMLAVCSGNRGCGNRENMTCDAHKGNEVIKVNPCDEATLQGITYTSTGRIQSSDPVVNDDLNHRLNLNSNGSSLPENRKQVLQALIDDVAKKHERGNISVYCRRKLEQIQSMDDPKLPFVGILVWWLEKHIER